jgi:hypothetical protein
MLHSFGHIVDIQHRDRPLVMVSPFLSLIWTVVCVSPSAKEVSNDRHDRTRSGVR